MAKQLNIDLNVRANTDQAKRAMMELQQSLTKVAGSFATSGGKGMDTQLKAAATAAQQLSHHLSVAYNADTGKINLNKFSASLKSANTDLKTLSSSLLATGANGQEAFVRLAQNIAAAERPVVSLNSKLTGLWTVLKNTARWQISSTILHGFMGTVQQAYGYAKDLNKSLTSIGIVTGYNTDRMAAFAVEANKAAKALSTTTNEYAKGSLIYFQQGLGQEEAIRRTDATVKMANVTGQSMEQTSNQLTAIWNNFAKGSKELESFADKITALGAATASSSAEISEGLNQFAAVAETVGLSYDYATAALATVVATTRQSANVVGTAFKTLFARIEGLKLGDTLEDGTDLNKYSEALMAVGVNIKEANGEMKNMDKILDEIGAKWDTLAKDQQIALAQAVAGVRQYTQFIALMDNWDFMQENLETVANATGTLQKQQERYAESWEAANKRLRASTEAVFTDLIDDKFFISITNGFAQMVDGIHDFIEGIGGVKTLIIGLGSIILSTMAQKIEPAFRNIANNVKTMFQTPQQQAKQYQSQFNSILSAARDATGINPNTFSPTEKLALEQAEQLTNMKNKLMLVSKNLTEGEKQQYEAQIRLVEAEQKDLQLLSQKIEKQQELIDQNFERLTTEKALKEIDELYASDRKNLQSEESDLRLQLAAADSASEAKEISKQLIQNAEAQEALKTKINNTKSAQIELNMALGEGYLQLHNLGDANKNADSVIINLGEHLGETANRITSLSNEIQSGQAPNLTFQKGLQAIREEIQSLQLKEVPGITERLENLNNLSKHSNVNVEVIKNGLKALADAVKNAKLEFDKTPEGIKKAEEVLGNFGLKINELSKQIGPASRNMSELITRTKNLSDVANGFNITHVQRGIETITRSAAAAGSIAMLTSSFKNLFSTLQDSNASGLEKFSSILMSISMIIPSAITGFSNLDKAVQGFEAWSSKLSEGTEISEQITKLENTINNLENSTDWENSTLSYINDSLGEQANKIEELSQVRQELNEIQENGQTIQELLNELNIEGAAAEELQNIAIKQNGKVSKQQILLAKLKTEWGEKEKAGIIGRIQAYIAEKIVVESLGKTILALLPAIAIIVAAGAAIYGIVKLVEYFIKVFNDAKPENKIAKVEEATQRAKEAANKAKEEYENLLNTLKNYKDGINNIEKLIKGTDEWTEAIRKTNEEATELIKTFGLLADEFYVDENGIIRITEKGSNRIKQENYDTMIKAQAAEGQATIREINTRNGLLADQFSFGAVNSRQWELSNYEKFVANANQYGGLEFALKNTSVQEKAKILGWDPNKLSTAEKEFLMALYKHSDAILENAEKIEQNNADLEANHKLQLETQLKNSEQYQNMDSEQKAIANRQYESAYNKAFENAQADVSNWNREAILDEYATIYGYDRNKLSFSGNTIQLKDKNGDKQDISNIANAVDDIAAGIASLNAIESLSNNINNYSNISKKTGYSASTIASLSEGQIGEISANEIVKLQAINERGNVERFNLAQELGIDPKELGERIQADYDALFQLGQKEISAAIRYGYSASEVKKYELNEDTGRLDNYQDQMNQASQYSNTSEEIDKLRGALAAHNKEAILAAEAELKFATACGQVAQTSSVSADAVEMLAKAYEKEGASTEEALRMAEAFFKNNKAMEKVQKNAEDYTDALSALGKAAGKTSKEIGKVLNSSNIEKITDVQGALSSIFGTDVDWEWMANNSELINQYLTSGEENLGDQLYASLIKSHQEIGNMPAEIQAVYDSMEDGAQVVDDATLSWMQSVIDSWTGSAEALHDYFWDMGFDVPIEVTADTTQAEEALGNVEAQAEETKEAATYEIGAEAKTDNIETSQPVTHYGVHFENIGGIPVDIPSVVNPLASFFTGSELTMNHVIFPNMKAVLDPAEQENIVNTPVTTLSMGPDGARKRPSTVTGFSPGGEKGKKGGGGGGGKTASHSATISKPTIRRYSKVQNNVDSINKQLDILGKNKSRVWGKSQIDIMDQEIDRLGKLREGYEDFAKEIAGTNWDKLYKKMRNGEGLIREDIANAEGYLGKDYQKLMSGGSFQYLATVGDKGQEKRIGYYKSLEEELKEYGLEGLLFGENGKIANSDDVLDAIDQIEIQAQDRYDNLIAEQQTDEAKTELEEAKRRKETLTDLFNQYQETADKNYENFGEWLQSIFDRQDRIIERIDTKLKNGIDISERTLKRLEYTGKIIGDNVYKAAELMKTWWSNGEGRDSWTEAQREWGYTDEAYKSLQQRLAEGAFDGNYSGYLNELRELQNQGYNIIDQLLELDEKNRTYYSEVIEKATEEMAKLTDEIAHNSSVLEHMQNVLSLLGKSMDYKAIGTMLRGQRDIAKSQMDVSTAQYQSAKTAFDRVEAEYKANVGNWSEDQIRYFEQSMLEPARQRLREAYEKMYEDTEAFLEKVRAVFDNTLKQIMKESEDAFTNNLGWDYVNNSMTLANSIQDEYLTKTNQIYETNALMRKLAQDIDKVDSAAAKTKLKNFKDEILAMQQQEKLTQTGLEIAKARYELLQAEMALEDVKNAKSIVRLQRDNEGNYGYVYTADQDAVAEAEANWAAKQNDLYNLVLGKTNEYNQRIVQATKERDDALTKLAEEYADKDIEHNEEYWKKRNQIEQYYGDLIYSYQQSLNSSLFWLGETAATDTNEAWSQSFSNIVDNCLNYEDIVISTNEKLDKNFQELNDSREEISREVKNDLDDIKKKTDDLTTSTSEYAKKIQNELLPKLDKEIEKVDASTLAYINKRKEVEKLIDKIMELNKLIDNTLDEQAGLYSGDLSKQYAEAIVAGNYDEAERILAQRNDSNTNIKNDMLREGGAIVKQGGIASQLALKGFTKVTQGSYYQDLDFILKKALGMASGGYTGNWSNNDGKLALLHQKELVLNAEDTKNILSSVAMIREIASTIDLRAAASNLATGLLAPIFQNSASNAMNQNVTITAEFPNATNRNEIEAAFDNLINRASQFAGRWGN